MTHERYTNEWVREMAAEARRKPGLVNNRFADCETLRDVIEAWDEIYNIGPTPWRTPPKPARLVIDNTKVEPQQA